VLGASYIVSNYDVTKRLDARSVPLTPPPQVVSYCCKVNYTLCAGVCR
jgi:hypothetical protein